MVMTVFPLNVVQVKWLFVIVNILLLLLYAKGLMIEGDNMMVIGWILYFILFR